MFSEQVPVSIEKPEMWFEAYVRETFDRQKSKILTYLNTIQAADTRLWDGGKDYELISDAIKRLETVNLSLSGYIAQSSLGKYSLLGNRVTLARYGFVDGETTTITDQNFEQFTDQIYATINHELWHAVWLQELDHNEKLLSLIGDECFRDAVAHFRQKKESKNELEFLGNKKKIEDDSSLDINQKAQALKKLHRKKNRNWRKLGRLMRNDVWPFLKNYFFLHNELYAKLQTLKMEMTLHGYTPLTFKSLTYYFQDLKEAQTNDKKKSNNPFHDSQQIYHYLGWIEWIENIIFQILDSLVYEGDNGKAEMTERVKQA